jgi:formyltetrahydrofolate synthetase
MPQLDIVSYFPQFFWFCIFFTGFYVTLVQNYLPKLTRIFVVRQAVQQGTTGNVTTKEFEELETKTQNVFSKSIEVTKKNCTKQFKTTQELLGIQTDIFNKHTNQAFQKYQNKKIQFNQKVKQTMQQIQDVLPVYNTRANQMNQKKTAQFFCKALIQKVSSGPTKTKLK